MPPILLFDGVCNLCNFWVKFIAKRDKNKLIKFASLQSEVGSALKQQYLPAETGLGSVIFIENGLAYTKSTAALMLCKHLQRPWPWFSLFKILPVGFRDSIYDWVARNRYKWFGQKNQCMLPDETLKKQFL